MSRTEYTLRLFGGFELRRNGIPLGVPLSGQRLLAFLALCRSSLPRCYVAGILWPDTDENKAHANLRTVLWRARPLLGDVLRASKGEIALDPGVSVDAAALQDAAREHRRTGRLPDAGTLLEIHGELLPGFWDSWLVFDRERLRQEAIHLLEASSNDCLSRGQTHIATMLGMCAVECDPLRESSNLLVVRAHLDDGDVIGATRHARRYSKLLRDELGVRPPCSLQELMRSYHTQDPVSEPTAVPADLVPQ